MPHFLDIPERTANDPTAPYAVLPLPYERTVTYGKGTADAPLAILAASHETEDFDEELRIALDLRVQTLPAPDLNTLPDADALELIRRTAAPHMKDDRFVLSLGGEHSITAPLVEAAAHTSPGLSVLHLDAHLDLRDTYGNTAHSHACVMRRIREMGIPTVHAGTRSCSAAEAQLAMAEDIPVFWAGDIIQETDSSWIDAILAKLNDTVYVTIDIDVFDPSLVPGTGTPEPGGLDWRQVTRLLRNVVKDKDVVSADIVEVAPIPHTQVSEFVAARLGAKLLTYHRYRDRL